MDIAAMNVRITFQKGITGTDRYGNHMNSWENVYTCWATPVMASGDESEGAGTTQVRERLDFTVRYCSELSGVFADTHRILCRGQVYNILSVNPMGYKNRSLKFCCERERRQ